MSPVGSAVPPAGASTVCGPDEHCLTCGDVALPMRVVRLQPADGLAWCRGPGAEVEALVETGLVGQVRAGDLVLVHAGTALVRLDDPAGGGA
jgi:hydrogenase maturation factor